MRTVLIVGGPCDGMRIEQEQATGRIEVPVQGRGMVGHTVQKLRGRLGEVYLASPDHVMDSLAYLVARYPQFIEAD